MIAVKKAKNERLINSADTTNIETKFGTFSLKVSNVKYKNNIVVAKAFDSEKTPTGRKKPVTLS